MTRFSMLAACCLVMCTVTRALAGGAGKADRIAGLPDCPERGYDITETTDCYCSAEARKEVKGGNVFGTGPYHYYSPICMAALHAGATGKEGGNIRIFVRPPQTSFPGSLANGVFSAEYGSSKKNSFDVISLDPQK